jgi:hypothetical protein
MNPKSKIQNPKLIMLPVDLCAIARACGANDSRYAMGMVRLIARKDRLRLSATDSRVLVDCTHSLSGVVPDCEAFLHGWALRRAWKWRERIIDRTVKLVMHPDGGGELSFNLPAIGVSLAWPALDIPRFPGHPDTDRYLDGILALQPPLPIGGFDPAMLALAESILQDLSGQQDLSGHYSGHMVRLSGGAATAVLMGKEAKS